MGKEINLLPERYKNAGYRRRVKGIKTAALAFAVMVAFAALYTPAFMVGHMKRMSGELENKISAKGETESFVRMYGELQREIERRNTIIEGISPKRLKWSELILLIGRQAPEGVSLTSVSCGKEDNLSIKGQAFACSLVARFLARLQSMGDIAEVKSISIVQMEGGLYEFDVECRLKDGSDRNETQ